MAGVIDALKLGWRSVGANAARNALGHEAVEAIRTKTINDAIGRGVTAQQLAALHPQLQANGENFLKDFHAAYKPPTFDSVPENLAYGASQRLSGVANGAGQMVQGMGGIPGLALQAAFIAPMFMGGMGQQEQPQEYTPEEIEMIRRQQQQQQGQYQ